MPLVEIIRRNPVWQKYGSQAWNYPLGGAEHYWGWSVRPHWPNLTTRLDSVNSNWHSTDLVVNLVTYGGGPPDGGMIQVSVLRVS